MPLPCPADIPQPGTHAISLLDIQNEFDAPGATYPIGIKEYYRDGTTGYVKTNLEGTTDKIPTSGPISFADFFCGNGEIVAYISQNTENVDVSKYFDKSWGSLRSKRLIVMPGVTVYNTKFTEYAMRIYDNFNGKLIIENRGSIEGAGGTPYSFNIFNRYYNGSTHRYAPYAPTKNHVLEELNYFVSYGTPVSNPYTPYTLYQVTHPINGATILTISSAENSLLTNKIIQQIYSATFGQGSNGQTIIVPHPPVKTIVTSTIQYTIGGVPTGQYVPGYIPNYIDKLIVNGEIIPSSQYTATDGINIILDTPAQPDNTGSIGIVIYKKPWNSAKVGYVYTLQPDSTFIPIYRLYKGSSSTLPTDYLFSTDKDEVPAGYTYQGIAFYAPPTSSGKGGNAIYIGPPGSVSPNPKPTVYINNLGTIYAGGGAGGQGGSIDVGLSDPVKYLYGDGGGQLEITLQGKGAGGGLGGKGQGYNQSNTSGENGSGIGVKADILMDRVGPNSFKFPPNSDITVFAIYSGQTNHYYSSNTNLKYDMIFSGTNGEMSFAGNNNSISLYRSGSGFQGTLTIDPSQTYTDGGASSGPIKTINYVLGGGPEQTPGQISVKSDLTSASKDIDLVIPVPGGAPGGKGGDGATWANTGATGNDNGLPGGKGGYSIVNASQYVSYINQGTIAGQTT
jgi:hypothetical protein